MNSLGLNDFGIFINKVLYRNNYIRAINYHSTPEDFMSQFEKQLKYYSEHYYSVSKEELEDFLKGNWNKDKPGLIISFDDGLESNYKYAKPLLEKYGFKGWFFIPTGLIETGNCKSEHLTGQTSESYMNWEQVRELNKGHIIGSHTVTHRRLKKGLDKQTLKEEVGGSKLYLEKMVRGDIDVFCWVGGESGSYSKEASEIIKMSDYKFSFLTNHYPILMNNNPFQLERTNIEANWPIHLIKFYTSSFMDFRYRKKRNKIKKLLD